MTHVRIWRYSLEEGEFAASCPSDIPEREVADLLAFIDLLRRQIGRIAVDDKVEAGEETHG